MKRLIALVLCVFGLMAAPLRANVELSFDFYYDQLAPLGEWVEVDGYGYVWHPTGVDEDWAPYIDGYWTYTDAGWTWVSYEEWGAICYHYGRWVHLLDYGWCWVPGYEWGPAWVSWRHSDDYIGWAPLPPECDWEPDRGVSVWVDVHYDIGPRWYSFCRVRDFGAPVLRHVLLPRFRNVEICFTTINITNISYNRRYGCVFNGGFDYDYIRARCDRPVPTLKLVQNTTNIFINNNGGNVLVNSPRGNALVVAAPPVAANAKNFTRKPAVRRTFKRDAVTRGWAGLEKPEVRDRLVSKMREETKGLSPANAKARPVKDEALAAVPKEVDLKARPPGFKRLPAERESRETATREGSVERPSTPGRVERMRPNGRSETAEAPKESEREKTNGRATAAGPDEGKGGLRTRPEREGTAERPTPAVTGRPQVEPQGPGESRGRETGKPERMITPQERANDRVPGRVAEQEKEKASRAAEMRDAQESARRQAQEAARESVVRENAARENAERAKAARESAARENAERQSRQSEQADAVRAAAERVQRQREAAENAGRAAEMNRQAQENAARENAARQNAARENAQRQQAAEAAAARRAQTEAERARQSRASDQAEAAQRQAAQRASENARREAAERQSENARRQLQERQSDNARQQALQRQAEAQRERAAAQQNETRQRASEAARERAMDAQRQQAAESARARAMENQQRAAAAAQAQAQARAQSQAQSRAEAQAQQRAAEAASRRQSESRPQQQSDERDPRKRR